MKSGPRSPPALPGSVYKLEISRPGRGAEGRDLGVLQEVKCSVPLRGHQWEIGAQGHMIPDSDGKVDERVYHLQSASISITLCCPYNPCMEESGQGSHCR